jgi:hypothetical protein
MFVPCGPRELADRIVALLKGLLTTSPHLPWRKPASAGLEVTALDQPLCGSGQQDVRGDHDYRLHATALQRRRMR